jgi:hypothetical protein
VHPVGGFFVSGLHQGEAIQRFFAASFALQGGTSPLVSPQDWCASHAGCENQTTLKQMKIAFIAAAAALLAASCCPNAAPAPAPSKPAYVAPTK